MNLKDYAREILEGESLNSKLLVIPKLENIFEGQNKKEYTKLLMTVLKENS